MPIVITTTIDSHKFRDFPDFADRKMRDAVRDGTNHGARFMRSVVPHGKGTLQSAVYGHGPVTIAPSHFYGTVGVDEARAPHASFVDRGTGIDGPFHAPVVVKRPSRTDPSRPGAMRFFKNGEGAGKGIYRATVKIHPSSKIERGKHFLRKTYDSMTVWASIRTTEIVADTAGYFARP